MEMFINYTARTCVRAEPLVTASCIIFRMGQRQTGGLWQQQMCSVRNLHQKVPQVLFYPQKAEVHASIDTAGFGQRVGPIHDQSQVCACILKLQGR